MKKLLPFALLIPLLIGCNSQKRCARFVARNPECFQSSSDTLRDTILQIAPRIDTLLQIAPGDTILIPGPCGEIKISRDSSGAFRVYQKPEIKTIRERIREKIQLPAPCDCAKLQKELRDLKRSPARSRWSWLIWVAGFLSGWILSRALRRI